MELAGKALNALRNTTPTMDQCFSNEWFLFKLGAVLVKPVEFGHASPGAQCHWDVLWRASAC